MDWKKIRKIDAHVHVCPPERLREWRGNSENPFSHADLDAYLKIMETYHVERAVLLPVNDARLYYERADDTNRWFSGIQKRYPDQFYAFADVLMGNGYFYEEAPLVLERAVKDYGLKGLKLHPSNLNLNADSLEMVPVLRKAAELSVPVTVHSHPSRAGFHDSCAPDRINRMIQAFPDVTFITAHLGGMKWQDAITGCTFVDMSGVLPELVKLYGVEQTNRILRMFGPERLIFATDFPDVWYTSPENVYETYCDILNQMDFTEEEAGRIAYRNMADILGIA